MKMGKFYQLFAGSVLLIVLGFLCDFSTSKSAVSSTFNRQHTFSANYQFPNKSNDADRVSREHLSITTGINNCQVHPSGDDHHNGNLVFKYLLPVYFSFSSFNTVSVSNLPANYSLLSMKEKLFANFYSHHAFW